MRRESRALSEHSTSRYRARRSRLRHRAGRGTASSRSRLSARLEMRRCQREQAQHCPQIRFKPPIF